MAVAQFLFGLVVMLFALAGLGLTVGLACWLVLLAVRRLPLVGRRHRDAHGASAEAVRNDGAKA